ncbi:tetratricopeptide repeat protein [Radiobacillus sp. PE A8.2]|uniref:tetratricopeptide repeat protein n=1 Tax=Radiobacillus sp. PE A8.2 TaxID=3380349 RepID=UPI00388DBDC0
MHTLEDTKNTINNIIPFIPEGDFFFTKGVAAFQKRKFDVALKWLKKAVEQSPDEALYQCQLSIIYTEIGAYHVANQILTEVLSTNGDSYIDCYYLIANNYAHLGLLQDAKKYITCYLEKAPDGDFREESEQLLEMIDIDDEEDIDEDWALEEEDELLLYQETAFYHLQRQEWDRAIPLLQEMMEIFPEHVSARHEYSYALFFDGNKEKAMELELKWLEEDPNSLYALTNLAVFYYEQQNLFANNKIISCLQNVYPMHEQQELRIASTLARTGYNQDAYVRFIRLSASKLKGHADYYQWYSKAAYHTGNVEKATALWQEGMKRHSILRNKPCPWEA